MKSMFLIRPEDLPLDHVLQSGPEDSPFTKALRNSGMREASASLRSLVVVFLHM